MRCGVFLLKIQIPESSSLTFFSIWGMLATLQNKGAFDTAHNTVVDTLKAEGLDSLPGGRALVGGLCLCLGSQLPQQGQH